MRYLKPCLFAWAAVACTAASLPATGQEVYKCGYGKYSQQPCAGRVVKTFDAPVPVRKMEAQRREQQQLLAQVLRREPGESDAEYQLRRRRARLLPEDSAECARLDKRMPVEESRLDSFDKDEAHDADVALQNGRKRYRQLHC